MVSRALFNIGGEGIRPHSIDPYSCWLGQPEQRTFHKQVDHVIINLMTHPFFTNQIKINKYINYQVVRRERIHIPIKNGSLGATIRLSQQ
jgi:hypothetical protein